MIRNKELIERFMRYVKIDTQSREDTDLHPSTQKQFDLARVLVSELEAMGAEVDFDDEHCYVYAYVPGNEPALGFVAHMDTSPAASDTGVSPRIIENYQGEDPILKTEDFPELLSHIGEDLIATDGTTLLGADDKAGVAEVMTAAAYFLAHPEIPHRAIAIAFTPDEEVGAGTACFDPKRFRAGEGYTIDGGKLGEIEYECFNAAAAKIVITGRSVHPGSAKNLMVNACTVAMEFEAMFPPAETPEHTEGYEGFYLLTEMAGDVDHAELKYILRDHDPEKLEARKAFVKRAAAYMNEKYGEGTLEITIRDQYRNMAEVMKDHMEMIEKVSEVMKELGITPLVQPIRGGTDGANLCFMGIPCPNLSTGGYNFHGRFEYASVQEMEKMTEVIIGLLKV